MNKNALSGDEDLEFLVFLFSLCVEKQNENNNPRGFCSSGVCCILVFFTFISWSSQPPPLPRIGPASSQSPAK